MKKIWWWSFVNVKWFVWKLTFTKMKKRTNGFYPQCKNCVRDYCTRKRKKVIRHTHTFPENRVTKICHHNDYQRDMSKSDPPLKLNSNTRCRARKILKFEMKSSSTIGIFGVCNEIYKNEVSCKWVQRWIAVILKSIT